MQDFSNISTIEEQIDYGMDTPLSNSIMHMKEKFKDKNDRVIVHCATPLITKYWDIIQNYVVDIELTEDEFLKYARRPRLLSLDKYETIELWASILLINNMVSPVQFNKRKIKMFTTDILEILEELLILEEGNIKLNDAYIERTDNV
nr:MAG TPA: hypothetical protein [Caudoviricetes sp.]